VLITGFGDLVTYAPSVVTVMGAVLEMFRRSGIADNWGPFNYLSWLRLPSPEAERFNDKGEAGFNRYIYRDTTYAEIKSEWARSSSCDLPGDLDVGVAWPEDLAKMGVSGGGFSPLDVLDRWIRPATKEEVATAQALERDVRRHQESTRILATWGFDDHGEMRADAVATQWQQRAEPAWRETRARFAELGLLQGSLFDHEQEIWTVFAGGVGALQKFSGEPHYTKRAAAIVRLVERMKETAATGGAVGDVLKGPIRQVSVPIGTYDVKRSTPEGPIICVRRSPLSEKAASPACGLSKVAGMADLKEQLMHEVIGPFKDPELYRRYRVSLPNGILFYGPPGCGKTYIARSLAEELGWSFQYCRPSDVASPFIHDTVSRIRAVFAAAIEEAPSIVFIDEFEAFVPARSDLGGHQQYKAEEVNEFLANLEGCAERKVLVIAATNEPEKIDPAVRRSGRFDKLIFIAPPDAEARRAMLEFHLRDRPVDASLDAAGIATVLDGYSASDIKLLVDDASRMALKRAETISTSTLLAALERVPASITPEDVQRYSAFRARG
jgi:ATP-dependent 26S proteasome regulatory subunit